MPANFLHGVETIKVPNGRRQVRLVKTAVTGLVGLSPIGAVNTPILVASDKDAAQFGTDIGGGFTIASALDANFDQGRPSSGVVIVVNVLDPAVHQSPIIGESVSFGTNGKAKTAKPALQNLTLKSADGTITYVANTDYTVDLLTGTITKVSAAIGDTAKADYVYADPSLITHADIIGSVTTTGKRLGMQSWLDSFTLFGFFPKRLIAPGYSPLVSVSAELEVLANRLRARAYIDAPIGTTRAEAIAGRGPAGTINFNTSAGRVRLCYPHVKVYDKSTDSERLEPLSQRLAGLGNAVDIEKGYWWSLSNQNIAGITGTEITLSAMINDPNCDVNLLNEVGITTVFNSFGTGLRAWGNRMANYPAETIPETFESVLAVDDVVAESIEYFSLQFQDQPGSRAWRDAVCESVNAFIRKLVADGALVDGKCWFPEEDNTVEEMAAGHYVFARDLMPPTPAERITHKTAINIDYLRKLYK